MATVIEARKHRTESLTALSLMSPYFIRNKAGTLARVRGYLKPTGKLLMVEYNSDQGNTWVPYPFAYPTWERMSRESGFGHTELLATYPSRFLREIYAAVSW